MTNAANTTWFAVFYQETGEEGIIHPNEGETLEQLLERAPEEWRFRYTEEPNSSKAKASHWNDDDDVFDDYGAYDY